MEIANGKNPVFICNHSGGKDSQAMFLYLQKRIPKEMLFVVHAHLPEVEWDGVREHIKSTIGSIQYREAQAVKTFFEMVDHRQMWPSPNNRQCTSDLKRGPIQKVVIGICNTLGFDLVINCMGMRAEESPGRAKRQSFSRVDSNCNGKREWFEWLPIHHWKESQVFKYIAAHGQKPHWVYSAGMNRCSCRFCIMSSRADLITAAKLDPAGASRYMAKEREINHTFSMPGKDGRKFLDEILNPVQP
jgi:3'-phosphoadenosine 5'-phosphosulfate sulfotransferase (PAPS reductase)/FAD synthetase